MDLTHCSVYFGTINFLVHALMFVTCKLAAQKACLLARETSLNTLHVHLLDLQVLVVCFERNWSSHSIDPHPFSDVHAIWTNGHWIVRVSANVGAANYLFTTTCCCHFVSQVHLLHFLHLRSV